MQSCKHGKHLVNCFECYKAWPPRTWQDWKRQMQIEREAREAALHSFQKVFGIGPGRAE